MSFFITFLLRVGNPSGGRVPTLQWLRSDSEWRMKEISMECAGDPNRAGPYRTGRRRRSVVDDFVAGAFDEVA